MCVSHRSPMRMEVHAKHTHTHTNKKKNISVRGFDLRILPLLLPVTVTLPFTVYRLPFTVYRLPFTVTVYRLP